MITIFFLTYLNLHSSLKYNLLMFFTSQEEMMAKRKVHHVLKVLCVSVCVGVRDLSNTEVKHMQKIKSNVMCKNERVSNTNWSPTGKFFLALRIFLGLKLH